MVIFARELVILQVSCKKEGYLLAILQHSGSIIYNLASVLQESWLL